MIESTFCSERQQSDNESNRTSSLPPRYSKHQINLIPKKKKQKYRIFKSNRQIITNPITNVAAPNNFSSHNTAEPRKLELSNVKVTSSKTNQSFPESPAKGFQKNHFLPSKHSV